MRRIAVALAVLSPLLAAPIATHAPALVVLGQPDFVLRQTNSVAPGARSLSSPEGAALAGGRLIVADTFNNRVLVWNSVPAANDAPADVVLGQKDFSATSCGPKTLFWPYAVASDGVRLFVADTFHNRVLLWNSIPTENGTPPNVVLGQPDFVSTGFGLGPSAMSSPWAIATDGTRLFVLDSGNYRVLVWNTIPAVNGAPADLVLGQPDFVSDAPGLSATRFDWAEGIAVAGGRIIVADSGNLRVLVWNTIPAVNGAPADLVLGQTDFVSSADPGVPTPTNVAYATGVASDGTRLYVSDPYWYNRVLVWTTFPTVDNQAADLVLGQPDLTTSTWPWPPDSQSLDSARSLATDGTRLAIVDEADSRVKLHLSPPAADNAPADAVVGQASFSGYEPNRSLPNAANFNGPHGVASDGTRLIVSDMWNNRVLIHNGLPTANYEPADVVVGQPDFTSTAAAVATMTQPRGVATDGIRLVVADYGNHRVLIYNSVPAANGAAPDVVLGQPDLTTAIPNFGGIGPSSLNFPWGVEIAGGRLIVADSSNHRVLIWNSIPAANFTPADVVVGQPDFVTGTPGTSAAKFQLPAGVASDGVRLIVADDQNHRVMVFSSIPTVNGAAATLVLGQPDFVSGIGNNGGLSARSLQFPIDAWTDGNRLFVADNANNRVLEWRPFPTANFAEASLVVGQPDFTTAAGITPCWQTGPRRLYTPRSLVHAAGRLVVADSNDHRVVLYDDSPASPAPDDDDDDGCGLLGIEALIVLIIALGRGSRR